MSQVISTLPNDVKERLSIAYITAIAARAGCQVTIAAIDKQSIDATIRPIQGRKFSIDLQLKATSQKCIEGDHVNFNLPINNYDMLRDVHCTAPHYLVILVLDPDDALWLVSDDESLILRRCAYWVDLRGKPPSTNTTSIKISIPRVNRFDVEALVKMLHSALSMITID